MALTESNAKRASLRLQQSILAALTGSTDTPPTDLVYSIVVITEATAGIADLGVVANATDVIRLHKLILTMRAQGTVTVGYDDDAAATNAVVLTGPITLGAGGGIFDREKNPAKCLKTIVAAGTGPDPYKHMTITFGTAGGDGYALISKGPA